MGTYHELITCRGTLSSWESCREILYDMPADKRPEIFGPQDDPTVTEELPQKITSCKGTHEFFLENLISHSLTKTHPISRRKMFRQSLQYRRA